MDKPVRSVRKPEPGPKSGSRGTWTSVIEGVLSIDVEAAHARLEAEISLGHPATGSQILESLDRCQENAMLARKLAAKARRDYELEKEAHDAWLEVKKSAARVALEAEKKEKDLKKQITVDMILDQVRATWPDEYLDRVRRLKDFQAAVHVLEELAEAWRDRPRALAAMKDIVLAIGR